MSIETDLTPAELAYFESGGDASQVLAEQGRRSPPPEADGAPALSPAEEHYFRTGGDVTDDLKYEHGVGRQPDREPVRLPPAAQAMIDRANAAAQDERLKRARTEERLNLLTEAVQQQEQPQQLEGLSRPEHDPQVPGSRYRDETKDPIGALYDVVNHARELEGDRAYQSLLAEADARSGGEFSEAYRHAMASHTAELMAKRYPGATIQQIWQAMAQPGGIPEDIRRQVEADERATWGRNPNAPADIIRFAQGRGWRSRAYVKAEQDARAAQERDQKARAAAAAQRKEDAIDERMAKLSRRLQYMPFSEFSYEDRKFYRENCRNPNLLQGSM
jgi:hypothetical protein